MSEALDRIANALDRLSPIPLAQPDFDKCDAFLWQTNPMGCYRASQSASRSGKDRQHLEQSALGRVAARATQSPARHEPRVVGRETGKS